MEESDELARRGIQEPDGGLVQVGGFGWIEEALQAEGLLRSVSIPCFLKN